MVWFLNPKRFGSITLFANPVNEVFIFKFRLQIQKESDKSKFEKKSYAKI